MTAAAQARGEIVTCGSVRHWDTVDGVGAVSIAGAGNPRPGIQTVRVNCDVSRPMASRFVQNLRRGHYELGVDASPALRIADAFTELAQAI